jgi:two-component system, chemotaxis family, protein-glutamate methylesterase/glutaminase
MTPLKVLVVDDSAIVRKLLSDSLRNERDIEVVGMAADPFLARDMIVRLNPDVITLDIEMPRMDGISFLRRLMQHRPMPVIIISSLTQSGSAASIEALRAGAVDVLPKPGGPYSIGQVTEKLKERLRALRGMSSAGLGRVHAAPTEAHPSVTFKDIRAHRGILAIGASTGGPQAIEAVLSRLPGDTPPIVIVQHMPPHFTRTFAERLDRICAVRVVEASGGERLSPGVALIAPGDRHMLVERNGVVLTTRLTDGPPVHHQRPAVDVLFHSLAKLKGLPIVAMLLTGMGQDGADGMVALKQAGAETIAEDEHSCVVFGMPREAIARGGATHVATLLRIPALIPECFSRLAAADDGHRVTPGTQPPKTVARIG